MFHRSFWRLRKTPNRAKVLKGIENVLRMTCPGLRNPVHDYRLRSPIENAEHVFSRLNLGKHFGFEPSKIHEYFLFNWRG